MTSTKLYDLQLINQMCRGDNEKILKMTDFFIIQIAQSAQEITNAYSEKDFLMLERLVHKIKPTLAYFGTSLLEKELLDLEDLLMQKVEILELELKISNFNTLTKEVIDVLKKDFN